MPPVRTARSKRKQTRLQFQPLSSSSPVKNTYSAAVKHRLANVRFHGVLPKQTASSSEHEASDSLPTPQPTSPTTGNAQLASSSSPLSTLRTSPTLPPSFDDPSRSSDSDDDEIVVPSSKRRKLSRLQTEWDAGNTASATDQSHRRRQDVPLLTPTRRSSRLAIPNPVLPRSNFASPIQQLQSVDTPSSRKTRHMARQSNRMFSSRAVKGSPSFISPSRHLTPVDVSTSHGAAFSIGSAETSDDDAMVTRPINKRKALTRKAPQHDPFVVDDNAEIESDTRDDDIAPPRFRTAKRLSIGNTGVDEDDAEFATPEMEGSDDSSPPKLRRLEQRQETSNKAIKRSHARAARELEELAKDLEDLQDSDQNEGQVISRTRGGPVTTQRDKSKHHFEVLKRRRAGEKISRLIDSNVENYLDDNYDGIDIDNIGKEANRIEIISDDETEPSSMNTANHEDLIDDANFIVDDQMTSGRLGRPSTDVPLQFTSFASAKPRELFPHVIEWIVKNRISPAFNRHDEIYGLSFSRIDDQLKAQAGSRLISSAWNPIFKHAIMARPELHVTGLHDLDEELIHTCDACNKSNHPARYDFTFSGKAYSKDTLEPIDDSDKSDESDNNRGTSDTDNDAISCDEQGHILAPIERHFYLGRFCAANAEMGHKLTHWKRHLNEQVLSYLEDQNVLSAESIINREKLNKRRREKEAESIVDTMQETGTIRELWQAFQDDLEDARVGMEGHERKGGRGKGRIGSVRARQADGTVGDWVDGGAYHRVARAHASDSDM